MSTFEEYMTREREKTLAECRAKREAKLKKNKEYVMNWRARNKEHYNEYQRKWSSNNKELRRASQERYYENKLKELQGETIND